MLGFPFFLVYLHMGFSIHYGLYFALLCERMDRLYPTSGGTENRRGCQNKIPPANEECSEETTANPNACRLHNLPKSKTDPVVPTSRKDGIQLAPAPAEPIQATHQGIQRRR